MMVKKYKITHHNPPALAIILDKKFLMPGWIEVPMETTLDDVEYNKVTLTAKSKRIIHKPSPRPKKSIGSKYDYPVGLSSVEKKRYRTRMRALAKKAAD